MQTDSQVERELVKQFESLSDFDLLQFISDTQAEWSQYSVDVFGVALRLAVTDGRTALVGLLLKQRAQLEKHTSLLSEIAGLSILRIVDTGVSRLRILQLLLRSGMDVNLELQGLPLLHHAMQGKAYAQMSVLLAEGADSFARSSDSNFNAHELANHLGDAVALNMLRESWKN
jgi:ankyrin repeat protein